jgi:hypothetical protein
MRRYSASTGGWHAERLERALIAPGHEPALRARDADGRPDRRRLRGCYGGELALDACDVVLVRAITARLARAGRLPRRRAARAGRRRASRVVNGALAIEHTIDKFLASALLAAAACRRRGPIACERAGDALAAFDDSAPTSS